MVSGWFKSITFIGSFILLLLHQLHLRSSDIRCQRLKTPVLDYLGWRSLGHLGIWPLTILKRSVDEVSTLASSAHLADCINSRRQVGRTQDQGLHQLIESEVLNVWPVSGGNGGRRRQHTNNFAQRNAQRLILQLSTSISEPVKLGMDEDCILSARLLWVTLGLLNFPGNCCLSAFYIWTQEESEMLKSSSWHHARGMDRTGSSWPGILCSPGKVFQQKAGLPSGGWEQNYSSRHRQLGSIRLDRGRGWG